MPALCLLQTGAKVSPDAIELATKKPKMHKLLLEYSADIDGSIDSYEDESSSSSVENDGSTIFSGLNTYIASPEMKQFQTPMSTEDREYEEEIDRKLQFSRGDEAWTVHFTEKGFRYFYNTELDYSTWDDPRSKRVLFEQHSASQTQSRDLLPVSPSVHLLPASPSVQLHPSPGHTIKEVHVKPTTIAKSKLEKESSLGVETEVITPLEAATSDPKSILLAQIKSRCDKTAPSSETPTATDDKKQIKPSPTKEHPVAKTADPKSILLAQIRARASKNRSEKELNVPTHMKASAAPNDALHKYRKVPLPAILQRMSRDGVNDSVIEMFQQQTIQEDESVAPSQPSTKTIQSRKVVVASPAKPPAQQKEDLLKDKSMLKYIQMTKVGVPAAAVAMKMLQDGIDDKRINSFRVTYGLDPSDIMTQQLPAQPHRRSSKAMQKVHWSTIKEENLQNSLWTLSSPADTKISEKELVELESLFSASPPPRTSAKTAIGSKRGKGTRATSASFIEPKRANNIAISLAQYRSFNNFDDLTTAVASLDDSNLSAEKVNNMSALLPTTSELNQLKQLNGQVDGLGRAEGFFVAVAKTPRFKEKLFSFRYLLQYDDQINALKTNLDALEKACIEVITSKSLAYVCKKLLNIGNLMNAQNATGITLDSLIKIAKKKGGDGKISVIDHLMSTIDNNDAMCFKNEMPTLRECARLDLDEMKLSLKEMEAGAKSVDITIKAEQSLVDSEDERLKHSVDFLSRITPFQERAVRELKNMNELIARVTSKVDNLQRFFAEEQSTPATKIFEALLEFSRIVESSKEAYHRKQMALRRRGSMQRPRTANI